MSSVSLSILLISTISILLVLSLNKWTKRYINNYYFYLIISILYLIYFILFRYINDLRFILNSKIELMQTNEPYTYSFKMSKVLLLDLCPFVSVALPIALIIDKSKNIAKVISIYGFIGGVLTIYGNLIFIDSINIPIWKYLLLGEDPNYLMFSSHYITMLLSLSIILKSKKFTKWSLMGMIVFIVMFIIYVVSLSYNFNIKCNTTGLMVGDWTNPYPNYYWYSQYAFLNKTLNFSYPFNVVFWYLIATLIIVIIIWLKNIFSTSEELAPHLWWEKLNKIDSRINTILNKVEIFNKK